MKKTLVIMLIILLLAAVMATPIIAAPEEPAAAVTSVTGIAGETAKLTVSLSGFDKAANQIGITFVAEAGLTFDDTNSAWLKQGLLSNFDTSNNQGIWMADPAKDVNGDLVTLAFKLPEPEVGQQDLEYEVSCTVIVLNDSDTLGTVTATGKITVQKPCVDLTLNKTEMTLDLNEAPTDTLTVDTLSPANTTEKPTFTSSDETVVTVDSTGKVTALKRGNATITVTAGSISKTCAVKVECSHDKQEVIASQPTCQAPGNNKYYTCSCCDAILAADGRTETTVAAETLGKVPCSGGTATCAAKAVCSMCQQPYGEKAPHQMTRHDAVAATCTAGGKALHWTCSNEPCTGKYYGDEAGTQVLTTVDTQPDANNHVGETELKDTSTPNCFTPGYTGDVWCKSCNKIKEAGEEIPATEEHVPGTELVKGDNTHWYVCTVEGCGGKVNEVVHTFTWELDEEATENKTGLKHEECTCGATRSLNTEVPKLDHTHTGITHHEAVRSTCTLTGTLEHWTCASPKCEGKFYADEKCQFLLTIVVEEINANNHVGQTEIKDAREATCNVTGYTGDTYCLDCKAKILEGSNIEPTGLHTPGDTLQTDDKQHWKACTVCNAVIDDKKEDHVLLWITDQEPTEALAGKKHQECTVCKYTCDEDTEIEKLKHDPQFIKGKAATCTEVGIADHYLCSTCGKYYASTNGAVGDEITSDKLAIPASGHIYGTQWVTDGNNHWHACACGATADLAAHTTQVVGAVAATETKEGYTGDTVCPVCNHKIASGQVIPVLETQPTVTPTAPGATTPDPGKPSENNKTGIIIALIAGTVVALGGLAGIGYVLIKKKR